METSGVITHETVQGVLESIKVASEITARKYVPELNYLRGENGRLAKENQQLRTRLNIAIAAIVALALISFGFLLHVINS